MCPNTESLNSTNDKLDIDNQEIGGYLTWVKKLNKC